MNSKQLPDERIVALYWARDEQAIAETDRKYGGYLYTVAYNILHDTGDCEECRNDTYLQTWNTVPPQKPIHLQAYLTKLIRGISIDRYRARTRQKRVPSELTVSLDELAETLAEGSLPPQEIEATELSRVMEAYVAGLSPRRRFIFVSRYWCSDPPEAIAQMLGITASAVYKELSKIKAGLKARLEQEGFSV